MKPHVVIIGVGLIGGSLGLALKKARVARSVTGVFRRASQVRKARVRGAVDRGFTDSVRAVSGADIVFLCASPHTIVRLARRVMPHLKKGAILTDVGSTKADIVNRVEHFRRRDVSFVGGHPLAGSEKSGLAAAHPDLFRGATWILTRSRGASQQSIRQLKRVLSGIFASVRMLTPDSHDRILALTSHLPHALAVSLLLGIRPGHFPCIARGYKDMTRIAAGSPRLWREIFLTNRRHLRAELKDLQKELSNLQQALQNDHAISVTRFLSKGKRVRDRISKVN